MTMAQQRDKLVAHLYSQEELEPGLVGSKAASLLKLICQGVPVPDGFIVTSEAFRLHLEQSGLYERVSKELEGLKLSEPAEVERSSVTIQGLLQATPLSSELSKAVEKAYQDLDLAVVAVRSSAIAEDLPRASFAGQFQTCLGIIGPRNLLQAIKDVYASLYSQRALSYAMKKDIDIGGFRMAVVVQQMIPAEVSGVMFTRGHVGQGKDDIIIDAVYGLGEGLVSGRLAGDHFVISRKTFLVKQQILAEKSEKAVCNSVGGVCFEKVSEHLRNKPSLKEQDLRDLCSLGLKAEELFGCPQDIEWAFYRGRLYLLQARPITASIEAADSESLEEFLENERVRLKKKAGGRKVIWTNVAFAELCPAPTPFSMEIFKRMGGRDGGVPVAYRKDLGLGGQAADQVMEMICGRVYVDIERAVDLFVPKGLPIMLKVIEDLKKGDQAPPPLSMSISDWQPVFRPTWRDIFLWPIHLFKIANFLFRFKRTKRRFDREYRNKILPDCLSCINQIKKENSEKMADEELVASINNISDYLCRDPRRWYEVGNILSMATFGILSKLTRTWFKDDEDRIAAALVRGLDWNKTIEMNIALDRLARRNEDDPNLAGFIEEYGHRGTDELELAKPRWREDPSFIKKQIQSIRHKPDAQSMDGMFQRHRMKRLELERTLIKRLRLRLLRRLIWRVTLKDAQKYAPYRETPKHYFLIGYEQLRRRVLEAGRRLVRRGLLQGEEDVFYLYSWEIENSLLGNLPNSGDVASERRHERDLGLMIPLAPVIVSDRLAQALTEPSPEGVAELTGLPVSAGRATGVAWVVLDPRQMEQIPDDAILVTPYTDPSWTPLFLSAKALVSDVGSLVSHGSIIAREYGLPAVVNTQIATRVIRSGQRITVDGTKGKVYVYE